MEPGSSTEGESMLSTQAEECVCASLDRANNDFATDMKTFTTLGFWLISSLKALIRQLESLEARFPDPRIRTVLELLGPYSETFERHIWTSKDVSRQINVSIQDYAAIFLPEIVLSTKLSISEKLNLIGEYQLDLQEKSNTVRQYVEGLTLLSNDFNQLHCSWRCFSEQDGMSSTALHDICGELSAQTRSLSRCQLQIYSLGERAGIFPMASAAHLAISSICPHAWNYAITTLPDTPLTSQFRSLFSERAEIEDKIMELTQTRLALSEGLDEVKRVDIHFVEHKEKFDLFSESIVHVATILAGMKEDLDTITNHLRIADGNGTSITFIQRLNRATKLYLFLAALLTYYQKTVVVVRQHAIHTYNFTSRR